MAIPMTTLWIYHDACGSIIWQLHVEQSVVQATRARLDIDSPAYGAFSLVKKLYAGSQSSEMRSLYVKDCSPLHPPAATTHDRQH